jgi:hypothetical protein
MPIATTARDVAAMLALGDPDAGAPRTAGVADIVRAAVYRWGQCPKGSVTRWVRQTLRAAGFSDGYDVEPVYSQLLAIGDIAEIQVGGFVRLARVKPLWIRLGEEHGCLIGSIPTGMLSRRRPFELLASSHSIARRFRMCASCAATIAEMEAECIGVRTWLGRYQFHDCAARRHHTVEHLGDWWRALESDVANSGAPAGDLALYRFVGDQPGGFFGHAQAAHGRWYAGYAGEGTWLAARAGYSEDHMNYSLVSTRATGNFAIDTYNYDEWTWCLLARGLAMGNPEVVRIHDGDAEITVEATCPMPQQLRRLIMLWCEPRDPGMTPRDTWSWKCCAEWKNQIQTHLTSAGLSVELNA